LTAQKFINWEKSTILKQFIFLLGILLLAGSCTKKKTDKKDKVLPEFYKQAYAYRDSGKKDSAFLYFSKAKDQYLEEKDSLGAGSCLVNMAIISTDLGDLFGGQELSLEAISYLDESDPAQGVYFLSNYNNLGIASYNLKQYSKAVEFYKKSLEFISDSAYARIIKNNIANAYRKEGNFDEAIETYKSALEDEKDALNYSRVLSNLAYTRWLKDKGYDASTELRRALSIRIKEKDLWGQNSSYAQLADYYTKKLPDSALFFSRKMLEAANSLKSADDQVEALQKLIPLSGNEDSKRYFKTHQELTDSLQTLRNNAKNQFVLIRFETEKHKAENLKLQQENTVRAFWIISISALFILSIGISLWWYKKRKQALELQAKNAIRESRLKTSKKVHDVVANGLYRLMSEMENTIPLDQEKILDGMEVLYEQSRDISYESDEQVESDFHVLIKNLLMSFATADTKVVIVGNNAETWQLVAEEHKYELKQVLQELMVNMKKHSRATTVAIKFSTEVGVLKVGYSDNGQGMPAETVFGNGLRNTGNRIKSMGGSISFDVGAEGGLTIQIQIPAVPN
jgi:tetratricopeptide (TPR) repeat protein